MVSDKTRMGLPDRRWKQELRLVVTGPPSMPTPQGVPHVFRCGCDEFHWLSSLLQSGLPAAHSKSDPNLDVSSKAEKQAGSVQLFQRP